MLLQLPIGSTSKIIQFPIFDSSSTTGALLTGLVFNTASLTAYYNREGAAGAATAITLVTATKGTWTSSGFIVIDGTNMPGWYELHIPDAALASGAKSVSIHLKGATNMVPVPILIELTATSNQDAVRGGMTAMPNVASGSAGAIIVSGTGTAALSVSAGLVTLAGVTHTGAVIPTVSTLTGHTANTGDPFARLGAPAGASVSADVLAIKNETATILGDTNDIQTRIPAALVAGRMDSSTGAMAANVITATAINADAITDAKVAADVTIASVTGAVGSVTGAVGSVTGAVGSVTGLTTATVHADLDDIQARLPAALVGGRIDASAGAMAANVITAAAIADAAIDRATFAADTGLVSVRSNTAQAGASTTITLDASASATTDFYKNALIVITGGTGAIQGRYCTAYNGTTKVATVSAWAVNPDVTSTFAIIAADAIVGATAPTAVQVADEVQTRTIAAVTTVNGLAANVITAAATAADFTTEIQAGLATAAALTVVDDFLDTEIAAILAAVDTEVAAIKAKTDSLTFTLANHLDVNVLAAGGDTGAGAKLKRVLLGNVTATVGAASTTTSIVTSSMSPAASVADQFKGRIVTFDDATTTAALRGQSTDITASTSLGVLTVTALTTAAVSGDTFTIS